MAVLAQGYIKLKYNTTGTTYVVIPGVFDSSGGGTSPNLIDATDYDTPAGATESIPGPRGNNPWTFNLHYQQGDTAQEALFTAEAGNTSMKFRLEFGSGAQAKGVTFDAVPSLSVAAPVQGKVTYSVTLTPLAAPVRATIA